jgi:iron complex outermembrane receptor protein
MSGRKVHSISILTPAFIVGFVALNSPVTAPVAVAQEIGGVVEEIIVTVRRREETVKDVPATVYVFTEENIARSNITRAGEIALLTPGVSLVDAAEVGDAQVNIRGMNGARDAENSYALVIDGITMTNPAALNREYANLQQIEVLKGPQGAIYGRNGSAGAFIINTRKPGEEFGGQVTASAAEDSSYRLVATIDGPMGDTLGGSLSGDYRTTDGFYNNVYQDRDDITDNMETWSVTGRLLWEPSDKLALDTKLHYGEVDASSITFNSVFHIPGLVPVVGPTGYENVNDHQFVWYNNITHQNDQETTEFSMKLDYELEFATLTAWGLYSDIENSLGADGTSAAFGFFNGDQPCIDTVAALGTGGANFPLNSPQFMGMTPTTVILDPNGSLLGAYTPTACDGTQYQERNQTDYSFELRLASSGDKQLRWNAGIYYLNIDREVGVNLGIDRLNAPSYTGASPLPSLYTANLTNPTEQLVWDDFDTDVYSAFGGIAYDLGDAWTVDFALRYDREERSVSNKVPFGPSFLTQYVNSCMLDFTNSGGTPLNPGQCNPQGAGPGPIPDNSKNFDEWQPKLSATVDLTDQWTMFGSIGTSFRSGGFNNSGSAATVDNFINIPLGLCDPAVAGCVASGNSRVGIQDEYRKETATAFELGFKSNLANNAVRLEGAIYYTEVDDMQFFEFVVGSFGLLRLVENVDEVEILGAELAVTWSATDWFDLFLGASVIDSEIKSNQVRPDTVGNESPYTPDSTGNLGAYFNFPVSKTMNLFANLDVSYIGKTWFHVVQAQERPITFALLVPGLTGEYSVARRDAYALSNLRLGIEHEKWTAALFATNLTDESFVEEVIPAPEFGGSFIHAGTERRIGADFTWRF